MDSSALDLLSILNIFDLKKLLGYRKLLKVSTMMKNPKLNLNKIGIYFALNNLSDIISWMRLHMRTWVLSQTNNLACLQKNLKMRYKKNPFVRMCIKID